MSSKIKYKTSFQRDLLADNEKLKEMYVVLNVEFAQKLYKFLVRCKSFGVACKKCQTSRRSVKT